MKHLLFPTILLSGFLFFSSSTAQTIAVADKLFPAQSATLTGFAGERLEASYRNRMLAQDVDRLVAPFRNRTETSC